MIKLRDYQQKCIDIINSLKPGNWLFQLPTGGGKTIIFTDYINNHSLGKVLIISHREELVNQPLKYINTSKSIEQSKSKADLESKVVSACIQSIVKRLDKYNPNHFDTIIWDEAHHCAAKSYKKVFEYFTPRLNLGFTATPNRADNIKLSDFFEKIVFKKSLQEMIKDNYLSDINCRRCYVNYDLRKCKTSGNDYSVKSLENEMIDNENPQAIAEIYKEHAKGQTLIFGVSVNHCEQIAKYIDGAVVVHAKTQNRSEIIKDFTDRKIKCLINCMIFTEGTDLPLIETIIIARPTKNESLYSQMVGRGLRLAKGKEKLYLIDCVGVTGNLSLCTAPSLLGINYKEPSKKDDLMIENDLFDLPELIEKLEDTPENWKINYKMVNLWAKKQNYNLHNVNWFRCSDGSFKLNFKSVNFHTSPIDQLGNLTCWGKEFEAQQFFDRVYLQLNKKYKNQEYCWNLNIIKSWGYKPASIGQIQLINRLLPKFDTYGLNKIQASQILNKIN